MPTKRSGPHCQEGAAPDARSAKTTGDFILPTDEKRVEVRLLWGDDNLLPVGHTAASLLALALVGIPEPYLSERQGQAFLASEAVERLSLLDNPKRRGRAFARDVAELVGAGMWTPVYEGRRWVGYEVAGYRALWDIKTQDSSSQGGGWRAHHPL